MTEVAEQDDRRWWHPLRSGVALALLLLGLGVATAALLGAAALGVAVLFDQALG